MSVGRIIVAPLLASLTMLIAHHAVVQRYSATQQAATWPGSPFFCSRGGMSIKHFFNTRTGSPPDMTFTVSWGLAAMGAWGGRGEGGGKGQREGGWEGEGTSPART